MRVLGVDIQKTDVITVILDGSSKEAVVENLEPIKTSFPQAGSDEADNLLLFEDQLVAKISQAKVECVAIVRAIGGMYAPSPIRVKIECLVQLASKRNNLPCQLVAPQTVSKAEKIIVKDGEKIKEVIEHLQPKYAQRAAYCAWSVLNAGN